jgi:hypothetical protein
MRVHVEVGPATGPSGDNSNSKISPPEATGENSGISPPSVSTTSNADKARQDELSTRSSSYQSKTTTPSGQPIDNQERVTLGQIVFGLNEESANVSGSRGGLQAPKTPGAGAGR